MKNEPKEIYLFCYDERETNPEYLPKDDDFQSLDAEFVSWGETKNEGCYDVKYVHHSVVNELAEALKSAAYFAKNYMEKEQIGNRQKVLDYYEAAINKALGH